VCSWSLISTWERQEDLAVAKWFVKSLFKFFYACEILLAYRAQESKYSTMAVSALTGEGSMSFAISRLILPSKARQTVQSFLSMVSLKLLYRFLDLGKPRYGRIQYSIGPTSMSK